MMYISTNDHDLLEHHSVGVAAIPEQNIKFN